MTLILRTGSDRFFREGLGHFSSRFGIPLATTGDSPLIRFEPEQIVDTDTPRIYGWLQLDTGAVPLFERPENRERPGDPVLFFKGKCGEFPVAWKDGDDLAVGFDLFRQVGISLSGALEDIWRESGPEKQAIVSSPFCDQYMDWLFRHIRAEYHKAGIPLVSKTFWPSRQPYAVCLTHDVDEVRKTTQWLTYPLRSLIRRDVTGLKDQFLSFLDFVRGREPFWTFEAIMAIEDSFGARSSWYFLQESCRTEFLDRKTWRHTGRRYTFSTPAVADLIHRMDAGGWEVGLHGSFSSYMNCDLLASELAALEDVLGRPVTGCRQHNLNLQVPKTWRCQQRAGIRYDTTLGFNDCTGFRWGTALPFHPPAASGHRSEDFLEIPLVIQDLPLLRGNKIQDTYQDIISNVKRHGGVLTLLWHHPVFNDHEFPGWGDVYADIIRICQQEGAWITTGRDICTWWHKRENASFHQDLQGSTLVISPGPGGPGILLDISFPPGHSPGNMQNGTLLMQSGDCYTVQYTPRRDGASIHIPVTTTGPAL